MSKIILNTLKTLKTLWDTEKEFYRNAEVGSGVQDFIYSVFQCSELFNLNAGILATKDSKRENEFIKEAKKKGRRADIVIFIDSDIVIPVEVEKYGNIKAGIQQIYNYQADWVKKYGILTDGNEWRFYNNTIIERTFFIDKVLDNPTDFLTFWKEYITPEYYYRSFFHKKGQQQLFDEYIPHLDEKREDFFKDITKLIENFKDKLKLKGYFKEVNDETEKAKKSVEITYAYLIQFILYKTLVDNQFADFEDDWKQRIITINNALNSKSYGEILQKIQGISSKISENIYKCFNDEQEVINKHLKGILDKPKNEISDVSVWLDILLFINRYNFANVKNEIFGYVYENYLKDLYLNEKKGQYFTDPLVVDFMLEQIGYTPENLKKRYAKDKDSISIIDPSCGSGTFLYNATARLVDTFFKNNQASAKAAEQIINDNIFGLDIAEFPLYLAEMNILMRMLPIIITEKYNNPIKQKIKMFKTRDSIAEFLDTALRNTITDITTQWKKDKGQMSLFTDLLDLGYQSHMRDYRDLQPLKESVENRNGIPRYRFDFVIGNPPYISFKECSKQNILFFQLQKEGKIRMNDIYGLNLHSVPGFRKKYAPNPNIYAYFIALGLVLLKDRAFFSFIIPQTLLTAGDLDVLRYHLSKFVTIHKIINFSGKMFVGRGIKQNKPIPTSSLIFVIEKIPSTPNHDIEVLNYNGDSESVEQVITNIRKGKKTRKIKVSQKKLLKNFINWNFLLQDEEFIDFYNDYKKNSDSLFQYYQHSEAERIFKHRFYFDRGLKFLKESIKTFLGDFNIPILLKHHYLAIKSTNFVDEKDIVLPYGTQGFVVYQQKYKILWRYINYDHFRFSENDVMIDYNHVVISSNCKEEILYLLSILNSKISVRIFNGFLRNENEKDILIGIKSIKEFLQVPVIDKENEKIKKEIILQSENLINLENFSLSNYADFKGILQQKFDSVEVQSNNLVIGYKTNYVKCKITGNTSLVQQTLNETLSSLTDENGTGNISELKNLLVIDFEKQEQIKEYIDDLGFALYFKIKLSVIGFSNREKIHDMVSKHRYFKLINS
ncbi:MAG: N-6 DNA methylase [Bacteroidota bacterium]